MSLLKKDFISSSAYNNLPHIHDVSDVPQNDSRDLDDLRALLVKYEVPKSVSIRLIHKHFDVEEGEVMLFENVTVPSKGSVQLMRPVELTEAARLRPIHYFVDEDGSLQSYEYATCEVADISSFQTFLVEFCLFVAEHGLQRKFGLKVNPESDDQPKISWTEYELPEKRSTILIPEGMPKPEGEYDVSVSTEWGGNYDHSGTSDPSLQSCSHCFHCSHCSHCAHCAHWKLDNDGGCSRFANDTNDETLYLGGQRILPGTPVYAIVSAVMAVC